MPKLRTDPETGKATFAIIQAEDELAAIGMVVGAGWAGARAMTSTSGPGLDLMAEIAGLAYFAEVPAVIWDVQRVGPSTGLPTRTSQADILSAYYLIRALAGAWGRYKDVDSDGIGYRTLPGTPHPGAAYFTRGTGHTESATYSERPEDWEANLNRLARKLDTARTLVPGPVVAEAQKARIGIISVGSNHPAIVEARDILSAAGIESSYMRLRALPINDTVREFMHRFERVFVVENNHDGQLHQILLSEEPLCGGDLISVARNNGLPLAAAWIAERILKDM